MTHSNPVITVANIIAQTLKTENFQAVVRNRDMICAPLIKAKRACTNTRLPDMYLISRAAESIWPEMISGQLFSHTFHLDLGCL